MLLLVEATYTLVRRAFVAIELSDVERGALVTALGELRNSAAFGAGRWVAPERMHLTLRFLGDTEAPDVTAVVAAIDRVAAAFSPMSLALAGTGFFPSERKPRIAWVGVGREVDTLARLASALSAELIGVGIAEDPKPFHPHLTLARVRHSAGGAERRALVALVSSLRIDVPIVARDLCLLGAPPDAADPRYATIHRAPLAGPRQP
jgi:2'-5' RNA ligase